VNVEAPAGAQKFYSILDTTPRSFIVKTTELFDSFQRLMVRSPPSSLLPPPSSLLRPPLPSPSLLPPYSTILLLSLLILILPQGPIYMRVIDDDLPSDYVFPDSEDFGKVDNADSAQVATFLEGLGYLMGENVSKEFAVAVGDCMFGGRE
jgi:hypothetical protein